MASAENPATDFDTQFRADLRKASCGAILWSTAYHGSGILSILSSSGAAFLAATDLSELAGSEPILIAALSGLAAMLTAISAFTGSSRKWRTNRNTRMKLRLLKLDRRDGDTDRLRDRFAHIMREHERGIVGAEAE